MSTGLKNTTMERMRKRAHGDAVLRLYRLDANGESLRLIDTLAIGFYIAPRSRKDMGYGAANHDMAIDLLANPTITEGDLQVLYMVDLVAPTRTRRFLVDKDDFPIADDTRYAVGLHAAFNNALPVL